MLNKLDNPDETVQIPRNTQLPKLTRLSGKF